MAKTSTDARKHIREWSEFFRDMQEVSEIVVDEFIKKYKQRKYLKQSLKRLIKNGFLVAKGNKIIPTVKGIEFFNRHAARSNDLIKWDGKWRLISFDVPVSYNFKRNQLRGLLKEFNFYQLQKSVWVCPNSLSEDFWKIVVKNDLDKYCKVMVVDIIEGDADLKKYFKVK